MEEITSPAQQMADQSDAFLAGLEDNAGANQFTAETQTTEALAQNDPLPAETHGGADAEQPSRPGNGSAEAPMPAWTVRHMGEEQTLQARDVTTELLQKGLDYDRVRGKYDEAKPVMALFTQFAEKAGMTPGDYARYLRAQIGGEPAAPAAGDAPNSRETANAAAEAAAAAARQDGIRTDLANFAAAFPEVYGKAKDNPGVIPKCVWDAVNSGRISLTAAYARYATAQANAAAGNQGNAARSTGSMRSVGNDTRTSDAFLLGLEG